MIRLRHVVFLLLFTIWTPLVVADQCEQLLADRSAIVDGLLKTTQWRIGVLKNQVEQQQNAGRDLERKLYRYYGSTINWGEGQIWNNYPQKTSINNKIKSLRAYGNGFALLLFHPYVFLNTEEFVRYLEKSNAPSGMDPWAILAEYSERLGTVNVYRGMALAPSTFKQVSRRGMRTPIATSLVSSLGEHVGEHFTRDHIKKSEDNSIFSVTFLPEVAVTVAQNYVKNKRNNYVFELEVPKIELIPGHDEKGGFNLNTKANKMIDKKLVFIMADGQKDYKYSSRIECFMSYGFRPKEIVAIHDSTQWIRDIRWVGWSTN